MAPQLEFKQVHAGELGKTFDSEPVVTTTHGAGLFRIYPETEYSERKKDTVPMKAGSKPLFRTLFLPDDRGDGAVVGRMLVLADAQRAASLWLDGTAFMSDNGRIVMHTGDDALRAQGSPRFVTNPTPKVLAFSKDRYTASAQERRRYGGNTVTEYYVMFATDERDASKWETITGYGKTAADRKRYAIAQFLERRGIAPATTMTARASNPTAALERRLAEGRTR